MPPWTRFEHGGASVDQDAPQLIGAQLGCLLVGSPSVASKIVLTVWALTSSLVPDQALTAATAAATAKVPGLLVVDVIIT